MRTWVKPDLVLLHPPSVYDFRERPILFGPISDVIPSTAIFEMYPVGFTSIAEYLERHGFRVRILNLANRMLADRRYDVEAALGKLRPRCAFGIDLHWLPHVQGSLEIAGICKRLFPGVPVIFGGFSASYFHEELAARPEVDFVVRGDSTEYPLRQLLESIAGDAGERLAAIPNLTWSRPDGKVVVNPLEHVPRNLDHYSQPYWNMIRTALRHLDIKGMLPIHDWWSYPICAVMTCRGCVHRCAFCGGSRPGLQLYGGRSRPSFRSPERIAEDILQIAEFTSAPIFVVGDLRQAGPAYAEVLFDRLRGKNIRNHIVVELFDRAPAAYFRKLKAVFPHFNLEMSPESHEPDVRKWSGKNYTNQELEATIAAALAEGCLKFDLFFMIGLPGQTYDSVMGTVDYCEKLLERFGNRLVPFISPLAPFIDPGSPIFERPDDFGYTLHHRSLEDFRSALLQPSWKYALSYETRWMNREQIVEATYEAALRVNRLKGRFGLVAEHTRRDVEERIVLAGKLIKKIDAFMSLSAQERQRAMADLRPDIERVNTDTLCQSNEIKWPLPNRNFRYHKIAAHLFRKALTRRPQAERY
jgi:B12-binding domain/radical SAM domain protein